VSTKILLLEDDLLFRETIEDFLEEEGYVIDLASDFDEALDKSYDNKYDLYILDINLPTSSGIELLKALRDSGDNTPSIFLTSNQTKDKLAEAYDSGADDYIKKPVDLDELLFRVHAILKRTKPISNIYNFSDNIYFDMELKRLYIDNSDYNLAPKASELLELLINKIGTIVTKDMIIDYLWASGEEFSDGAIRVYINSIKKALGKDRVSNIRGIGYRLEKNAI
jgi:DNA-binding response OmpR family regulator